ncbi:hypothetical protein [Burkholderia dolosa]|uniref:hypothetical protein n=1 Tax=Burkholderia dolosa TaxID=152500 RepID=UPI001FC81CA1|nr:hypothetical protein [Burkholderia dolosa]
MAAVIAQFIAAQTGRASVGDGATTTFLPVNISSFKDCVCDATPNVSRRRFDDPEINFRGERNGKYC